MPMYMYFIIIAFSIVVIYIAFLLCVTMFSNYVNRKRTNNLKKSYTYEDKDSKTSSKIFIGYKKAQINMAHRFGEDYNIFISLVSRKTYGLDAYTPDKILEESHDKYGFNAYKYMSKTDFYNGGVDITAIMHGSVVEHRKGYRADSQRVIKAQVRKGAGFQCVYCDTHCYTEMFIIARSFARGKRSLSEEILCEACITFVRLNPFSRLIPIKDKRALAFLDKCERTGYQSAFVHINTYLMFLLEEKGYSEMFDELSKLQKPSKL